VSVDRHEPDVGMNVQVMGRDGEQLQSGRGSSIGTCLRKRSEARGSRYRNRNQATLMRGFNECGDIGGMAMRGSFTIITNGEERS
jgi:hypothetical protein